MGTKDYRWQATVWYRTDRNGDIAVVHYLEELADLQDYVERGPHWDTITTIEVRRIRHVDSATLTVEQAECI